MADLNVTSNGVIAANSNTVVSSGYSAAAINAGQVVYLNSSQQLAPAQASSSTQAASVVGIALDSALGANQLVTYASAGDVVLPTSGTVLTNGVEYILSANAGAIAPSTDAVNPNFVTHLGLAVSPAVLRLNIMPVAAPR